MSGNNIKVVVRCRPLNSREKARGAQCLIRMEGNKTILSKPATSGSKVLEEPKAFTFDQSYWSADKDDIDYADQEKVFNDLGKDLLDHAFNGYNCCIFAYGQTGSGKSYSMVGYGEDKGITPRTCLELFERIKSKKSDTLDFQVEVSYIEIYNEKVRDLLNPRNKNNLKVREHPVLGPYVQNLSRLAVNSFEKIEQLMDEGNKARTVAATNMNETSSRSHAVFTIFLTQKVLDPSTKQTTEKVARISLVDLAGSERANSTGATGVRLKEGANINKSLTTLGKVIAGLAEQASANENGKKNSSNKKPRETFIPYRDSVLTWLLKDSLGGNSKTCMIAAISPADYDETLSTLRYADQAKKIKTKAVVNEDPNVKLMRELKDEVEALRQALMVYAPEEVEKIQAITHPTKTTKRPSSTASRPSVPTSSLNSTVVFTDASGNTVQLTKSEMVEQLQSTEKLLNELNQTWEEKLHKTEQIHIEREKSLKNLGITIEKNQVGLYTPKETPYLINLNEDPLMSECLMYNIMPGITYVDQFVADESEKLEERTDGSKSIRLSGSNINKDHCYFENKEDCVTLYPRANCIVMVNGRRIAEPKRLKSGYRIILGDHHVFRFNNPGEALKERETVQQRPESNETGNRSDATPSLVCDDGELDVPSPPPGTELMDWNFARREAVLNSYIHDSNLDRLTNEDLDKLFDDVAKVRIIRKRQSASSDTLSRHTSSSSSLRKSCYSTNALSMFLDDAIDGYYTTDTSTISSSFSSTSSLSDLISHKDSQELQFGKRPQSRLRRMSRALSFNSQTSSSSLPLPLPPLTFTSEEQVLATKVIHRWKRQRNIAMAKTILMHDVYVLQANHLAVKLNKDVFYRFAVVHDTNSVTAVSNWETSQPQKSSPLDIDLIRASKPCIAIQVIDRKHGSIYLWSIEKFMARLRYLEGAYYYASDYKKYLRGDDLFYESTKLNDNYYSLVGLAKVPLQNLTTQVPVESKLSVHCHDTGKLMGYIHVLIAPIARSVRHPYRSHSNSTLASSSKVKEDTSSTKDEPVVFFDDEDPRNLLHVGQQLVFEIAMIKLTDFDSDMFSQLHAQFRLSTFGSHLDGVFATEVANCDLLTNKQSIIFNYHQTLSMAITEEVLNIIKTKEIVFEVYGKPCRKYLEALSTHRDDVNKTIITPNLSSKKSEDVIAHIQICELASDGDYKPVPVETVNYYSSSSSSSTTSDTVILGQYDTFSLQQGHQRRIIISLQSSASFDKIIDMRIGHVRLLDSNKHRILNENATDDVIILNMISTTRGTDGSCIAQASWDSSLHDTKFLNAVTTPNHKVGLTLTWFVRQKSLLNGSEVDTTIRFERDIFVHIKDQTKATLLKKKINMVTQQQNKRLSGGNNNNNSIFHFFSAFKSSPVMKSQVMSLYTIEYQPELIGDLHGLLADSSQLLMEYEQARQKMIQREERDVVRYKVFLMQQLERLCGSVRDEEKKGSLETVLKLWKSQDRSIVSNKNDIMRSPVVVRRWIPKVQQILIPMMMTDNNKQKSFKRGFLMHKSDHDTWDKYWCLLIGCFMFLYTDQSETNEIDILHIRKVYKDENLMNSKTTFIIDTLYDSHTFQVPNNTNMTEWLTFMNSF
ncbi:uncharacterized protein BX663DRAFT_553457 [Cokeromyces recurvatus]|uniref:uncharacterized protein n=1 Tax=Cokeromyces recurvatus TaxID=90255 RepID=UPI00221F68BC|nr:uncharacterized protein BX663DRAFT_553457 [Cokeromyces recurvatus]KAI7901224.1 hypothetical protein BX663DRAFT_553457 [Cokeromyces recurvatus]